MPITGLELSEVVWCFGGQTRPYKCPTTLDKDFSVRKDGFYTNDSINEMTRGFLIEENKRLK